MMIATDIIKLNNYHFCEDETLFGYFDNRYVKMRKTEC